MSLQQPMTRKCDESKGLSCWINHITLRIGESHLRVIFQILTNLASSVLYGMLSTTNVIKGVFLSERNIVQLNSPPVRICTVHKTETDKTGEKQKDTVTNIMAEQIINRDLLQVAPTVTLKRLSKTSVLVATKAKGIVQFFTFTQLEKGYPCKVARGVIDV